MKQALLIIDIQNGFFDDEKQPVFNENLLIKNINRLLKKFRKNHEPVIFMRHTDTDELKPVSMAWQIYQKVEFQQGDYFLNKETPDCFLNTGLEPLMKDIGISSLIIAGLQTNYCVDTTCRSAYSKGIPVVLASDAHSTYGNEFMDAETTIRYHNKIIGRWFASLKTTEEIVNEK